MTDDKSNLNKYCQKKHVPTPVYRCESTGDGFACTLTIEETEYTSLNSHSTKKEAERDAANVAMRAVLTHHTASTFDDVLKLLDGLTLSGPPPSSSPRPPIPSPASSHPPPSLPGGRVINNVYVRATPPATTHPGLSLITPTQINVTTPTQMSIATPTQINVTTPTRIKVDTPPGFSLVTPTRMTVATPTNAVAPPTNVSVSTPLTIGSHRADIPTSIEGPSIDTHSKPSTVTPIPIRAPLTSEPNTKPPPLISVRPLTSEKDIKDLEQYCQASSLPLPVYTIYQERGKHVGKVRVGEMEFGRGWGYDTFNDAKDSAAIVAIAGIAMIQLQLLSQQQSGSESVSEGGVAKHCMASWPVELCRS